MVQDFLKAIHFLLFFPVHFLCAIKKKRHSHHTNSYASFIFSNLTNKWVFAKCTKAFKYRHCQELLQNYQLKTKGISNSWNYTRHCKSATVFSPFSHNSLNYLLHFLWALVHIKQHSLNGSLKSFYFSIIQGACSRHNLPRVNLQNHQNITFASQLLTSPLLSFCQKQHLKYSIWV